ncbi:hypothetical protein DENSPDRAFT_213915 [Dentipellis sp. KUC8613]|nr:hypothetical protein DENSPDRAFT_213915 [Dentipellis sp. KUC8613]
MLKRELPEAHAQAVVYCNQAASEGYALPSRASAAAHPDLSTGGFQIEPFAIPPLIPRAEAETIVDDILALSKKRFKTLNFEFTDMAGLEDAPDQDDDVESWKVRSIDVDAMSYEVFFLEMGAPIPHSREELVDLLSKSWHA